MNALDNLSVSAYDPYERFFASRYKQGERTAYSIDLSVRELVTFLPKPDAEKKLGTSATQRRIDPKHAKDFCDYILGEERWVAPSILLRGPDIFEWVVPEQLKGINTGTTQFGVLGIPKDARTDLQIVDGQHRTLGFHLAWEEISAKITEAREFLVNAKRQGEPSVITNAQDKLDGLLYRRDRLASERVSVQILVIEDPDDAKRIFVDINDNARGITGSVKSRFDDRKVITRALNDVLESNEFLKDIVDIQADRVSGKSEFLLGAKHVADMMRHLTVGTGRIGKVLEKSLSDTQIASEFNEFITAMTNAFPVLEKVGNGSVTPAELRAESLLGSNVVLRAFAVAWHTLKGEDYNLTSDEIEGRFSNMADHMAPVYADPKDTWFSTGVFPAVDDGTIAPTSRAQDFKTLADRIVEASADGYEWFRATEPAKSEDD